MTGSSTPHQSLNNSLSQQTERTEPPEPSMDLSRASQFYRAGGAPGEGGGWAGRPPLNPGLSFSSLEQEVRNGEERIKKTS